MSQGVTRVTVGIPTFNRADYLRESIASVLGQTYRDFQLLVCDNASYDATEATVASFADPRIRYVRAAENIGLDPNFNRVIELTETEFLVILPDDDILYPDYLRSTVEVLEARSSVGVVHTAFDLIDGSSQVVERGRMLVDVEGPLGIERGVDFLERSMRSPWTLCWSSALFRTKAIAGAGGLQPDDEPHRDFPLFMRISREWDYACLSKPLVAFRLHAAAATAALGSYTGTGYDLLDAQPQTLYRQRLRFLDEANVPPQLAERCRSTARRTLRSDRLLRIANRAGTGLPWTATLKELVDLIRADSRTLVLPATWKLCAAQLGGRQAKRALRRIRADDATVPVSDGSSV